MTNSLAFLFVVIAALLDVGANLLLAKADGFRQLRFGIGSIILVCLAFLMLSQAVRTCSQSFD